MNDQSPLGDINGTEPASASAASIVDTILDLDELLSSDVRLAEKSYRFSIRPDLEAKIEESNAELNDLTDSQGRPLPVIDQALGDGGRSAHSVALEIQELQVEYALSMRRGRVRQMDEDDWTAFLARHKTVLAEGEPFAAEFYEDLIVRSARQPKIGLEELQQLRKKVGHPAFDAIATAAWAVNTNSGVSVPKSSLSSAVLRQQQLG